MSEILVFDRNVFVTLSMHSVAAKYHWFKEFEDLGVVVHPDWIRSGYKWPAKFAGGKNKLPFVLDWCSTYAPNEHIIHNGGAVLFKDESMPTLFKLTMAD